MTGREGPCCCRSLPTPTTVLAGATSPCSWWGGDTQRPSHQHPQQRLLRTPDWKQCLPRGTGSRRALHRSAGVHQPKQLRPQQGLSQGLKALGGSCHSTTLVRCTQWRGAGALQLWL